MAETCSSVSGEVRVGGSAPAEGERKAPAEGGEGGASPGWQSRKPVRHICDWSSLLPLMPTWRQAETTINGVHHWNQIPSKPRSAQPPQISRNCMTPMSGASWYLHVMGSG